MRDEMYERRRNAAKPRPDNSELERAAPLWLTVNRYSPARKGRAASSSEQGTGNTQSEPDPVTLIFAHANGFSKEVRPSARLWYYDTLVLIRLLCPDMGTHSGASRRKVGHLPPR